MKTKIAKIEPTFLDLINYGVCSTLSKLYGREATEEVFRRAGKTNYQELRKRRRIDASNPISTLRSVASYLEEAGYMRRIELTEVTDSEAIIDMYGVSVAESSKRLADEGLIPSHYMTNMMFAALEDLHGVEASITHLDIEIPDEEIDHVRERWALRELGVKE